MPLFTLTELLHSATFAWRIASILKDITVNSVVNTITSTPSSFSLVKLVIAVGCIRILWCIKTWVAGASLHRIAF